MPVPNPPSPPAAPSPVGARLQSGIARASGFVCALALAAMALGIVAEIAARGFFSYSFRSAEEISGYLLVAVAFLGLAVAVHTNSLFRVEFVIERLNGKARQALELTITALFIVFLAILDYECAVLVIDSYRGGYLAPTLLATPLYVPQLLMPIGLTAALVVLIVRFLQALFGSPAAADKDGHHRR